MTDTGESAPVQLARNFNELLQELRVALSGVQILFAFLLAVAFTERYADGPSYIRTIHLVTVILVAISFGLLMAPAVWHRVLFRGGHRERILTIANRFTLCGIGFLAASMTGTVLLITEIAVGGITAIILTAGAAVMFTTLWFVVPQLITRNET
ncbi:DUF6328 family protein [Rhodococcus sp. ARC_M6]|uniref:DUF6328 family protein n=1 Tax=Rhodococcus sp. ARC_M6 TaxID=2928852 RepID=UPI001FB3BD3F|nr:DUF6328 family protein [Rhodococcus sp. ARC_M6]MCJ0906565.1 DUF6328 family protein [Rhodococcus sp. ARC_M6]